MSKIILVDALRYGDVSSDLADRDEHAHLLDDSVLCIHCARSTAYMWRVTSEWKST